MGLASWGCGNSEPAPETEAFSTIETPHDLFVTSQDIARAGRDAPSGAVLRWWQAMQFGDIDGVRKSYASDVSLRGLSELLHTLSPFIGTARPVISEQHKQGNSAKVLVFIQSASFRKGRATVTETPTTFTLRRQGTWKLADNRYLRRARATQGATIDEGNLPQSTTPSGTQ